MSGGPESQGDFAGTVTGLVFLLALAWIAGHSKLTRFERRLKVNPLILTGSVFIFLGLIASIPGVGILSGSMLAAIAPVLPFGLGWLGFRIGFDFDRDILRNPPGASTVLRGVLLPMVLVVGACSLIVWIVDSPRLQQLDFWRDLLLVSLTSAMTSTLSLRALTQRRRGIISVSKLAMLAELELVVILVGLIFIAVVFRPTGEGVGWQLPPLAWLFVTLGVGMAMGMIAYGLLSAVKKGPPFIVILLGTIAMAAGMASFLRLSVIGVCFVVGLVVSNLPGDWKNQVEAVLQRMEKPVLYLLLLIAGATWVPWDWRGWVLMLIVVGARLAGRSLNFRIARWQGDLELTEPEQRTLILAPGGVLAVAVIISARDLYESSQVPILLTATIGGALVCELLLLAAFPRLEEQP